MAHTDQGFAGPEVLQTFPTRLTMPLTASRLQYPLDGILADDDTMSGTEVRDDAMVGV